MAIIIFNFNNNHKFIIKSEAIRNILEYSLENMKQNSISFNLISVKSNVRLITSSCNR